MVIWSIEKWTLLKLFGICNASIYLSFPSGKAEQLKKKINELAIIENHLGILHTFSLNVSGQFTESLQFMTK